MTFGPLPWIINFTPGCTKPTIRPVRLVGSQILMSFRLRRNLELLIRIGSRRIWTTSPITERPFHPIQPVSRSRAEFTIFTGCRWNPPLALAGANNWNFRRAVPLLLAPIHFPGYYSQFQLPALETVSYYFASVTTPGTGAIGPGSAAQLWPLPLDSSFAVTNQTHVIIGAVGQPMVVGGWAKQQISNGSSSKFGYLGQYFDAAYKIDTNGMVTSGTTGILSPYGEFFPTEPGPVALVTMTNWGVNERGTGVVQVISLALDANHDGTMDTSFAGPDNTSAYRPFVFWANNNYDRSDYDADDATNYQDDVQSQGCPFTPDTPTPDCNYSDQFGIRIIPGTRDLEDYTRLWICGITTNFLAALPAGSTVSLNWGDVGSPNANNPTIDLSRPRMPMAVWNI